LLVRPEIRTVAGHEMDAPYTAIFHLSMAPRVTASNPADGQLMPPGQSSATLTFDRPMFAGQGQGTEPGSVLNPDNYHLMGQNGGLVDITSVTYDGATRTATLHFDILPADFYLLALETTLESADRVTLAQPFQANF